MSKHTAFTQPIFVLGEGVEDASFFRSLLQHRGVALSFEARPIPDMHSKNVQGKDSFGITFGTFAAQTTFPTVKKIVVLADNDDDPVASFQAVCDQLEKQRKQGTLNRNWAKPVQAGVMVNADPSVMIWMWPEPGVPGCLETLLWPVIQSAYPKESQCVLDAFQCSGAHTWSISKLHKAYVRCFISITCGKAPALALSKVWDKDATKHLIPLDHPSLDALTAVFSAI